MTDATPPILVSRLLDDALDAVIIIDDRCHIRYLNGAMRSLTGYAGEELLGQPLEGLLPDAVAARHTDYIRRYAQSCKPSRVLARIRQFAIRHRSAEMIPIEMKALDLGVIDGVRYFGAFMLDLRARRAMEARNASLLAQLERQALCDMLTGLPNRRAFEAEAGAAMARAARSLEPMVVGVADIDHFKKVNDMHGHAAGDAVLCAVSGAMREAGRVTDVVARLGGEEFGLLFAHATLEQAGRIAERVRDAIAAAGAVTADGTHLNVTISIGLAWLTPEGTLDDALRDADRALYRAKHLGRNRVEVAPAPRTGPGYASCARA